MTSRTLSVSNISKRSGGHASATWGDIIDGKTNVKLVTESETQDVIETESQNSFGRKQSEMEYSLPKICTKKVHVRN